eukprot:PLAT217.10.p1 GENE.PLAT217.10~~PLAT217.10.p1  ORF type:complete len:478 (-),score=177.44 PLAT217.10:38-1471(-)
MEIPPSPFDERRSLLITPGSTHEEAAPAATKKGAAGDSVYPARKIGLALFVMLAFFNVCGGPYGIEDAVRAAGAWPTVLSLLLLPALWGLPQALMTAEMSSMLPENGGYVLWVHRAFGYLPAFICSYNGTVANLFDLALYPVLVADNLKHFLPSLSPAAELAVKIGCVVVVAGVNCLGLELVSGVAAVLTLAMLAPFLVEPLLVWPSLDFSTVLLSRPTINWALFLSTMLWNYSGWDGLGAFAGEVTAPKRTYPLGVCISLLLISVNYMLPVVTGVALMGTNFNAWLPGFLITIAKRIAPWLGTWVIVGGMISGLGLLNVVMSTSARALWAMARGKMMPPWLGWENRLKAPVAAVMLQSVSTIVFARFDFSILVIYDTFLTNITLLMEMAAFIYLKWKEPELPRPYAVPGKKTGAVLITVPKVLLILATMLSTSWHVWAVVLLMNVAFLLCYAGHLYWLRKSGLRPPGKDQLHPHEM